MPAVPEFIDEQLVVGGERRLDGYEVWLGGGGKIVRQLCGAAGDDADALGGSESHAMAAWMRLPWTSVRR